jgi:alcohol dehydrogenase class IV
MNRFVYDALGGRVVFGAGTVLEVPAELDALRARRVMIIASGSSIHQADFLSNQLGDRLAARIDQVNPHVPIEDVERARNLVVASASQAVVTIGGGSAIGLGKNIAVRAPIQHLAIPTTYAGSEMTAIHGVTVDGVKRIGRDHRAKPQIVIYDPDLSRALPMRLTAGSTMNAAAHCIEALYAEQRNPVTSLIAMEGLRALRSGLERVVADRIDLVGRTSLLYGAFLGGAALGGVGMAIHHKICHVLGGTFGLSHGDANAVILPHVVAANAAAEPEVMGDIARVLGVVDPAAGLFDMAVAAGAPSSLAELGMYEHDLDRAADIVLENPGFNPRPVKRDWIRHLLDDAFLGRKPMAGSYLKRES